MLETLRNWISGRVASAGDAQWSDIARWAESRKYEFRHVRQSPGFVIDGRAGRTAWRLEWGPSQRGYVRGMELRLRADLGLAPDLQALILSRSLKESMEKDVFEQYVEAVQTRADTQTPPEMRWLVMYPPVSGHELGTMREHWAAVANLKPWLLGWLASPLGTELATRKPARDPVVLMVSRGRVVLRAGLADPAPADLEYWLSLFECALREAQRVTDDFTNDASSPSTQPSLWSASALPAEAPISAH